jgi:sugar O-acyltransferase (sialic acid O-acetyltransferase NeuD family)
MAAEVILPKLGMNMEAAIITSWLKHEGDRVAVGDVLAEVETDKATIELEADAAGVLRKLLAAEGEHVAVNQPIAVIGAAEEDISALVERLQAAPAGASSHVERTYEAWKHATPELAGRDGAASAASPSAPSAVPAREPGIDPEAIRARLAQRGVLKAPQSASTARKRLVIYGAGLGARQLLEVTRQLGDVEVVGLIDDNPELKDARIAGLPVLGGFGDLAGLAERGEIDGIALSFHSEVRRKVHRRIAAEVKLPILPLVDPRAIVGMDVQLGAGALIEAGAVVGPGTTIGEGTIVDVGAVVAHDCFLGPFSHLSPGCTLSGVVSLTENVLVGVGAAINSTVTIGRNVIITPGAAVMNDVGDDVVVGGVPAKMIGQSRRGA